jgi:hypothetical protein
MSEDPVKRRPCNFPLELLNLDLRHDKGSRERRRQQERAQEAAHAEFGTAISRINNRKYNEK